MPKVCHVAKVLPAVTDCCGLPAPQNNKGPLIPADSQGFLVSCVTGKELLASREATQLLGQVRPEHHAHVTTHASFTLTWTLMLRDREPLTA